MTEGFDFLHALDGEYLKDYSQCIVKDEMGTSQIESNRVAAIFNYKKKGPRNTISNSTDPQCDHSKIISKI